MNNYCEQAVERAIEVMRENLDQQLTIDDMARAAMFSKFHFTRVFQKVTGVTPARFLAALRLAEAQHLLVTTSLTVADITHRVGYNSPGTFSSRFTLSVGLSPSAYRQLRGYRPAISVDRLLERRQACTSATVHGLIQPTSTSVPGPTFVGLFGEAIPRGRPVSCAVIDRPGAYVLENVPEGEWYLLAHSVTLNVETRTFSAVQSLGRPTVGSDGPISVRRETVTVSRDLPLRPAGDLDPPVLLALLDTRIGALEESAG